MNFNLSGLLADYQSLKQSQADLVLATIIETGGSTYRKAGARMLITRENKFYGLLGGQELHRALLKDASEVLDSKQTRVVELDHSSRNGLALELEPGAKLSILLEYLSCEDGINTMELLSLAHNDRQGAILATVCDSNIDSCPPGASLLLNDKLTGNNSLEQNICSVIQESAELIKQSGTSSLESCMLELGVFSVFFDIITHPLHLLITGAGPDVIPVIQLAAAMSWKITVVDPRQDHASSEYLSKASRVLTADADELPKLVDLQTVDAVIIMSHRLDLDEKFLGCFKGNTHIGYIGLLGTEKRRKKLLDALAIRPEQTGEQIYGPAGLDTGGKSPEEIALSIIAEIQAVLYGGSGAHLTAALPRSPAVSSFDDKDIYAIILAAGGSRRFGGIKQLLEFDGKSLLKRAVETANKALNYRVKLVLGIKPNKLQREVDGYDIEVVNNRNWENGISSSIKAGINTLPENCKAVLIILCDQPLINESHLQMLIETWKQNNEKIIVSTFADTVGVPAIFPRKFFTALLDLKGDYGAKVVIEKNLDMVIPVPIPEAGIDIDTQEDVIKILSR